MRLCILLYIAFFIERDTLYVPMKLLYLANIRVPSEKGETLQIVKMCDAFSRMRNMNVELVVPRRINTALGGIDPYTYFGVRESFVIRKLSTVDLMPIRSLVGKLAFRLNYWLFIRTAVRYAQKQQPDIVYSRDWRIITRFENTQIKLVYELHDFRAQDVEGYKKVANMGVQIVVITHGLKEKLIEYGISEYCIMVSPDAVDIAEFDIMQSQEDARNALTLSAKKELVLYTGHLFDWKGVYTLVDASKLFPENRKLILVGGLPEDVARIREYCEQKNLHNVSVLGHQPYTQIPLYLKSADVVVLSDSLKYDISREYTSPLKLFQYMAAKRPIVAPKTPALLEMLSSSNAWLYEPDNAEAMAEAIDQAITEKETSKAHISSAWELVQGYTWEKRAEAIMRKIENEK